MPPDMTVPSWDTAITPEVERVLRALDERCLAAIYDLARACPSGVPSEDVLAAKADGLALARSYIADALRGVL